MPSGCARMFLQCLYLCLILRYYFILLVQGDRREPDVFEMISTHFFFKEKANLLQKNLRNYMPFELHIMNERCQAGGVHFLECSFQAFAENRRIRVPASHDQLLPLPP